MRKATYLFGAIITFLSFISCSNDSEPASDPAKDKELAEWIKSCVLDDKGDIVFVKSDAADGQYAIPAGSAENAKWFVEDLTRTEWDGQPKAVSLGEEGSVRIAGSEKEGVYNTIEFRIKGVPAFNLDITSWEYLNNDNSYGEIIAICFTKYYLCGNCINISRNFSQGGKCPHCGWSDGLDGDIEVGSLLCSTDAGFAYVITPEEAGEKDFKRCVGVVFYVGQHPDDDTEYFPYNSYNGDARICHGYAVSLHVADKCYWMQDPLYSIGACSTSSWNGFDNTRSMKYEEWQTTERDYFTASKACRDYTGEGRTAPHNSSGWFIPSIAQLDYVVNKVGKTITRSMDTIYLNSNRYPYGLYGTFWSSTEWGDDPNQVAYALERGNTVRIYKNRNVSVLPILAF